MKSCAQIQSYLTDAHYSKFAKRRALGYEGIINKMYQMTQTGVGFIVLVVAKLIGPTPDII